MNFLRTLSQTVDILTSGAISAFDIAKVRVLRGYKHKQCHDLYYQIGVAIQNQRSGVQEIIRLKQEIARIEQEILTAEVEWIGVEHELYDLNQQIEEAKNYRNKSLIKDLEERSGPLKNHSRSITNKISHLNGILKYTYVELGQVTYHHRAPGRRLDCLYREIDNLREEISALQQELTRRNTARSTQRRDDFFEIKQNLIALFTRRPPLPYPDREITIEVAGSHETQGQERLCPFCQSAIYERERAITCPRCETPHHEECWRANRGCSVFGCV